MNIHSASSMVDAFLCKLERCRNLLLHLQANFLHPYTPVSPFAELALVYIFFLTWNWVGLHQQRETRKLGKAQVKAITVHARKLLTPLNFLLRWVLSHVTFSGCRPRCSQERTSTSSSHSSNYSPAYVQFHHEQIHTDASCSFLLQDSCYSMFWGFFCCFSW